MLATLEHKIAGETTLQVRFWGSLEPEKCSPIVTIFMRSSDRSLINSGTNVTRNIQVG